MVVGVVELPELAVAAVAVALTARERRDLQLPEAKATMEELAEQFTAVVAAVHPPQASAVQRPEPVEMERPTP